MTYDEFKKMVIAQLKKDIALAQSAGEQAATEQEIGFYLGYTKHAQELLRLMFDAWVQPEMCDKCKTPTVYKPGRLYRHLCAKCATEELQEIMVYPQP